MKNFHGIKYGIHYYLFLDEDKDREAIAEAILIQMNDVCKELKIIEFIKLLDNLLEAIVQRTKIDYETEQIYCSCPKNNNYYKIAKIKNSEFRTIKKKFR